MIYNILFISARPVLANQGGVQRVTETLSDAFEDAGHNVYYLSLEKPRTEYDYSKRQYFSQDLDTDQSKSIDKLISDYTINIVINQAGIYKHITDILSKIENRNQIKLFTVHHNCVKCLNQRYREIVLGNKTSKLWSFLDTKLTWTVLRRLNRIKYGQLFKQSIKVSDKFVLLSENFIGELRIFGIKTNQDKVIAIPNPGSFVVQPKSVLKQKEKRVVFVGRLSKTQKRVDRLMKIWKEVNNKYADWEFDVIGDGNYKTWMQNYCKQHQLDRIHFHGFRDPRPYLEKAKIFTMTSDFEGFGMVLIEAQSYGVVPIAFNCFSSIGQIILDEKSGKIIDNFDTDIYQKELEKLMATPLLDDLAREAINHANTFEKSIVVDKWLNYFNK